MSYVGLSCNIKSRYLWTTLDYLILYCTSPTLFHRNQIPYSFLNSKDQTKEDMEEENAAIPCSFEFKKGHRGDNFQIK